MNYFTLEETPFNPKKYLIKPSFEKLPLYNTEGSYTIIMARLFNISFANFLRLCRDEYEAELVGKNTLYPIPYFKNFDKAKELIKELEKRADILLK